MDTNTDVLLTLLGHATTIQHICSMGWASLSNSAVIYAWIVIWSESELVEGHKFIYVKLTVSCIFLITTSKLEKHKISIIRVFGMEDNIYFSMFGWSKCLENILFGKKFLKNKEKWK